MGYDGCPYLRAVLLTVKIPALIKKFDLISILLKIGSPQLIHKPVRHGVTSLSLRKCQLNPCGDIPWSILSC
jgi:hypothetical protein